MLAHNVVRITSTNETVAATTSSYSQEIFTSETTSWGVGVCEIGTEEASEATRMVTQKAKILARKSEEIAVPVGKKGLKSGPMSP